jgi:hypothetical protein
MRRTVLFVPLVAACVVAGGIAVNAGGQGSGPPSGTLTLTITTKNSDGRFVDLPPRSRNPSDGDTFYGRGSVSGDASGTAYYSVTFVRGRPMLRGGLHLPNGDVFAEEFASEGNKAVRGAIVGGTGAYAGARGDFEDKPIKSTKSGDTSRLTITFMP